MDWPLVNGQLVDAQGENSGANYGTQINASGFPNADGAWASLGTLAAEAGAFIVKVSRLTSGGGPITNFNGLIDIGVDPAGGTAYTTILPDLYAATGGPNRVPAWTAFFPIALPAGGTLAARWRASTTNKVARVAVYPISFGWSSPFRLQQTFAFGTVPASSSATQVDPGGTANTKGSWVQMTSSTAIPIRHLTLITHQENVATTDCDWRVDVGVGAAGSETVVVPDLLRRGISLNDNLMPAATGVYLDIPQGTRLAVRAECSITDATDRLFKAALYGVA